MKRQFFRKAIAVCTLALYLLSTTEAMALMCGADLNDDGDVLAEGELASCTETYLPGNPEPQALCPVQAVDCTQGEVAPICPEGGTLDQDRDVCQIATDISCPDPSYLYNSSRNRCEKPPACPGGYLYDPASGQCSTGVTSCTATPSPLILTGTAKSLLYNCALTGSGNTLKGFCTVDDTYPTGTITATSGTTFTGTVGIGSCYLQGVGNTLKGFCTEQDIGTYPTGTITATSGTTFTGKISLSWGCYLQGAGNTIKGFCTADDTYPTGTITATSGTTFSCPITGGSACTGTPSTCIALTSPTCSGGTIDQTNKVCFAAYVPNCPSGYTYNGLPVNMCEAAASCVEGVYNPGSNQCAGAYTCPLGNYTCLDSGNAVYQCSPNPCIDPATIEEEVDDIEPAIMPNDGDVDEDGQCLDQLFIFSGSKSRCRPPGLTVGTLNNCCDSDEPVMSDAKTGNSIATAVSAVTTAYEIGQVAYYSSQVAAGAVTLSPLVGTTSVMAVSSTGAATMLTGAVAEGVATAAATGATTTGAAVTAGMQGYAAALLNPATIAFTAVAFVAVKILMGGGCDQKDIMTSLLRDSGNCHYVGSACERKWPIVGCVQKAKRYCCFNSKMARIIHEQGRPQLQGFAGLANYWGTTKAANCRGFTTDEFQMLDFAKIDMSAYFADMQKGLQGSIEGAQQKALDKVQQHYEQTLQ